jgi:hypothetical protein
MMACCAWAKPAHPSHADGPRRRCHALGVVIAWRACPGRRDGASAEGSPVVCLPWGRGRGHEGGGRGAPSKVEKGAAHRGGRSVGGAAGRDRCDGVPTAREVGQRLAKLHTTLPFCEREEEVRLSPNGENGEECARRQLSPRIGDGVGGVAESSVRGGAPRVEWSKK